MQESGCKMSSTDGYIGHGKFNVNNRYKIYNAEHYINDLKNIFLSKNSSLLINGIPKIWNKDLLSIHNLVICSSCVISKDLIENTGMFDIVPNGQEDYRYWLKILEHTDSVYIYEPCFYYDLGHGYGQNY
jgi:hypothetical protein